MRPKVFIALSLWVSMSASIVHAQNVTNYSTMPDPLLFLLREPAVHADLRLTERQRKQLLALNEQVDGSLLASRNKTPETAQASVGKVMDETRQLVSKLLTASQQNRLRQLKYRVRGISFVLTPDAATDLELTADQKKQIQQIVTDAEAEVRQIQRQMSDSQQTYAEANQAATKVQTEKQRQILATLDDEQKRTLVTLVGPAFNLSRLGKVAFRAPQLLDQGTWINSKPLKMSNLHGKVVALHFWAFG